MKLQRKAEGPIEISPADAPQHVNILASETGTRVSASMTSETQNIPERKEAEKLSDLGITRVQLDQALLDLRKQDGDKVNEARSRGQHSFYHEDAVKLASVSLVLEKFRKAKGGNIYFLRTETVLHKDYEPPTDLKGHEIGQLAYEGGTAQSRAAGGELDTYSYFYERK